MTTDNKNQGYRSENSRDQITRIADPTPLTTQQILREIASLKELFDTRLDGMDKAMELFNANITRVPTDTDKQISHLKELHEEKFHSIEKQFIERDVRTEQTARDSKVAVDAALQAAKEAVGEQNKSNAASITKSEAAFTKQIAAIGTLITTTNKASDDKIDDIKKRLTVFDGLIASMNGRTVGVTVGTEQVNTRHDANWGIIIGISGVAIAAVTLIMFVMKAVGH